MVRFLVVSAVLLAASTSLAQREFIEEVESPKKPGDLGGVDLDAPDPAEAPKRPLDAAKPADAKPDPKADPKVDAKPEPAAGTPTDAQADPKKDPNAAAPGDAAADPVAAAPPGGVVVNATTYAALAERATARAAAFRRGEVAKGRRLSEQLDQGLLDFGVQGTAGGFEAPGIARSLCAEARELLDDGDAPEALERLDLAARAAPDLTEVPLHRARAHLAAGDPGAAVKDLVDAAATVLRDVPTAASVLGRAVFVLLAALLSTLLLAMVVVSVPALRLLAFDILTLLPRGPADAQILALVFLVAAGPAVVGAGPVLGVLWIACLAWIYLDKRSHVVLAAVAVAAAAVPFLTFAFAHTIAFEASPAALTHRALKDAAGDDARAALRAQKSADLGPLEQTALALADVREGRLEEAREALERLERTHGDLPFVRGALGVVLATSGQEDQALTELGRAAEADPDLIAASFNMSLLHHRAGRTDKGNSALAPITDDAAAITTFRRATYRAPDEVVNQNRALVAILPPPLASLSPDALNHPLATALEDDLSRRLVRGQKGATAALVLLAFPAAWGLLLLARKRLRPAVACVRCGSPASRRVDAREVPEDTCSQCFHAFISTKTRVDAGVRLRKERQIVRRQRRLARVILALAFVWGGAGHLAGGAPARGVVLSFLFGLGVFGAVASSELLPHTSGPGAFGTTPAVAAFAGFAVVVWIVSLRGAAALSREASGQGRR